MAAVNVDRRVDAVFGNLRTIQAQIDIAATLDTYVTGFKQILSVSVTPSQSSATQIGVTLSGGTITFVTGGAEANCQLEVVGL